jgi:alkylhydroperoxidase/carboxymuconolactone decarboxylase family protein YurZ
MSYDYWVEISKDELQVLDTEIRQFRGRASERTAWMSQHLGPVLTNKANHLATIAVSSVQPSPTTTSKHLNRNRLSAMISMRPIWQI